MLCLWFNLFSIQSVRRSFLVQIQFSQSSVRKMFNVQEYKFKPPRAQNHNKITFIYVDF